MRALALILALLAGPVAAVTPSEMLKDPALEARARSISEGLRCPVCQNETIDQSNASLAHDLRVLVRERLKTGDTDAQVVDFIVQRYGEFVLLDPPASGINWILWGAGPLMLLLAGGGAALYLRRRRKAPEDDTALTEAERARLSEIMRG